MSQLDLIIFLLSTKKRWKLSAEWTGLTNDKTTLFSCTRKKVRNSEFKNRNLILKYHAIARLKCENNEKQAKAYK